MSQAGGGQTLSPESTWRMGLPVMAGTKPEKKKKKKSLWLL
jgi:hypothetical protein